MSTMVIGGVKMETLALMLGVLGLMAFVRL
jgi:hypothetical protein